MGIKHNKVSPFPDENNIDLVRPSDWNALHNVDPPLHRHYFNEIPIKVNSKVFHTLQEYTLGTLCVYLNGLREKNIIEISKNQFQFIDDLIPEDEVIIDYVKIEV